MARAVRGSHHGLGDHFRGDRIYAQPGMVLGVHRLLLGSVEAHRDSMLTIGRPCVFSEGVKPLVRPEVVNDSLFFSAESRFKLTTSRVSHWTS